MKQLLALAFLLVALGACGQEVLYKSSATLEWDAVVADTGVCNGLRNERRGRMVAHGVGHGRTPRT